MRVRVRVVVEKALRDFNLVYSICFGKCAEVLKNDFAIIVLVQVSEAFLKVILIKGTVWVDELADALCVRSKHFPVDESNRVCVDLIVDSSSLVHVGRCGFLFDRLLSLLYKIFKVRVGLKGAK